jgi:hypothetical protein
MSFAVGLSAVTAVEAANGETARLANIETSPSMITFQPLIPYMLVRVTVTGPEGFVAVKTFNAGDNPRVSLPGVDGFYKYELRFAPVLDDKAKAELAAARRDGTEPTSADPTFAEATTQSGAFTVADGNVVPEALEPSAKVVLTNGDGVVRNSLCVGFDCPDAPAFGDSTILMMENNTRIKFGDTSNAPFPNNDWEIEANSATSGGANYLGFNDCGTADNDGGCADDVVFAVEAGARRSALYVESDGDVGIGTSNPVLDLHIVTGNTPSIRLDQDGSSGFAPQVWDMAGNETNFFVRDVTNGSTLPFRIRPGAPSNSIFIDTDGDVGIGTGSPGFAVHLVRNGVNAAYVAQRSDGATTFMNSTATFGQFGTTTNHALRLLVNTDTKMTLNADDSLTMKSGATCSVGGSWIDASSRQLKGDIHSLSSDDAMAALQGLDPVTFRYKADLTDQKVGFIAEDVPEIVATNDRKGLSPMDIVAILTKVAKDQQATIDKLQQRVDAMERCDHN